MTDQNDDDDSCFDEDQYNFFRQVRLFVKQRMDKSKEEVIKELKEYCLIISHAISDKDAEEYYHRYYKLELEQNNGTTNK